MIIVKTSDVAQKEVTSGIFEGKLTTQSLIEESKEIRAVLVNFAPGARNVLHSHSRDQILYVTEGKGIVATKEKEYVVTPGTTIFFAAGEPHWHGATKDSSFSHISFTVPGHQTTKLT